MKFWLATLVWLAIGVVLGAGIYYLTAKGNPWLFIVSMVGFVAAVSYFCATDPSSTPDHH